VPRATGGRGGIRANAEVRFPLGSCARGAAEDRLGPTAAGWVRQVGGNVGASRRPPARAVRACRRDWAHVRLRRQRDVAESSQARMTIAVTAVWHDRRGVVHAGDLGNVPPPVAREIARTYSDSELDGTIDCVFLPAPGRRAGLRISIWASEPRPRRPCRACANWLPPHAAYCPVCGLGRGPTPAWPGSAGRAQLG